MKHWNRSYVSEFTAFIDRYLEEHPEVVADQHRGWVIYWNHKVDFKAQKEAEADSVPDDSYGFYGPAWRGKDRDATRH